MAYVAGGFSREGQRLDSLLVRRDIFVRDLEHVARRQEFSRERDDDPADGERDEDDLARGLCVHNNCKWLGGDAASQARGGGVTPRSERRE